MLTFQRSQTRPQGVNVARAVQATAHPAPGNIATEIFRCPLHLHAGPLRLVRSTGNQEDDNGCPREWVCEQCGRVYPVVHGILDLLARAEAPDPDQATEVTIVDGTSVTRPVRSAWRSGISADGRAPTGQPKLLQNPQLLHACWPL